MSNSIKIIYVMDPHCGWCFGFSTVISKLFEHSQNNPSIEFDVLPGGLFSPPIQTGKEFADDKRPIAKRIEKLAGVQFSENYFNKVLGEGSFLDSEPPARAIMTVKLINKALLIPFTEKLIEKEFVQAKNNSLTNTIFETVTEFNLDETVFNECFHSDMLSKNTRSAFQTVRNTTNGYPALFLKKDTHIISLAKGYAPAEKLINQIDTLHVQTPET